MGIMSMCKNCGSDWCGGECIAISPANLRFIASHIPNSGHVGDLRKLADYFEREPSVLSHALGNLLEARKQGKVVD